MATAPKTISGPLGAKFGRDPTEFFINAVKSQKKLFRRLTARLAARTNVGSWEVKKDGKTYKSRMVAREDDSIQKLATIIALWCLKDPVTTADEAGRMAYGRGVGPSTKSLDEFDPSTEDVSIIGTEQWPIPWGMGSASEKGEPITAAVVLTAGVAILVAIAPFVLPKILAFAEETFNKVTGKEPKASSTVTKTKEAKIFGIPATFVAVGGAALLAYAALRK